MPQNNPNICRVDSLEDPRLAVYRNLKDRELERMEQRFIAEGDFVVRRLLASGYQTESVLLAEGQVDEIAPLVPASVPVYVTSAAQVNRIVGFRFHSGVMACGFRKPSLTLEQAAAGWKESVMLVVLPEVTKTDNLGALFRISAGFGADAVILGEHCCDPFYRQSVRVSMGTVFRLSIVQSQNLLADLRELRGRYGVELAATVLDETAEPLHLASRGARFGLLFGNEAQGLSPEQIAACNRRITIPMKLGTDSLNVAVSAGVFLYHFTKDR